MLCVSCRQRKGKRACPALRGLICPTCCGTKRLKEINCPPDCQYLASAQAHPAAAVLRQRERDLPLLATLLEGLSAPQGDLLAMLQTHARNHRATAMPPLRDEDVRDAAASLAATLETAARGIVFEHQPTSIPALRLMRAWQEMLAEIERHGGGALKPAMVAGVLRRTEQAARDAAKTLGTGSDTAFLDFLDRVMRGPSRDAKDAGPGGAHGHVHGPDTPSGIIVP
jgi:hypothetical protein